MKLIKNIFTYLIILIILIIPANASFNILGDSYISDGSLNIDNQILEENIVNFTGNITFKSYHDNGTILYVGQNSLGSNDRVGINTNDPKAHGIHIWTDSSGLLPGAYPTSSQFIIEDDYIPIQTFLSNTSGTPMINFGDSDDNDRSKFGYNHSSDKFFWKLANSNIMLLSALTGDLWINGDLSLGVTVPKSKLDLALTTGETGLTIGEDNAINYMNITYDVINDRGIIQSYDGFNPDELLLNPEGGKVGIGISSPSAKLDIEGSGETYAFRVRSTNNDYLLSVEGDDLGGDGEIEVGNFQFNGDMQYNSPPSTAISSGEIDLTTFNGTYFTVTNEAGAGTDNLDCIDGGREGIRIIFRTFASTQDPTLRHAQCGVTADRILLPGGADITLTTTHHLVECMHLGNTIGWKCWAYQ